MPHPPECLRPDWPAPANVLAICTTRQGGVSRPPYHGCNLGAHVGDDPAHVAANRALVAERLPASTAVQWLAQVHGTRVVEAAADGGVPEADASWSDQPGMGCAVLTADCLPVLFCADDGSAVAAAHAGWRGLQAGVLESTLRALPVAPARMLAWLGPAIGPAAFEVGPEVRAAFLAAAAAPDAGVTDGCFAPAPGGRYLADLYALARLRLSRAGVAGVYGGGFCTFTDARRFYSYRRDGSTGRMAAVVLRR